MPTEAKKEAMRRKPLSDAALETLAAMVDDDLLLLSCSSGMGHSPRLMAKDGRGRADPDKMPFKITRQSLEALLGRGFIERGDSAKLDEVIREGRTAAGKPPRVNSKGQPISAFAWYDIPNVVTGVGKAALEAERGRLADIRAARRHAEESPRFVVAARNNYGDRLPGVGSLLRVLRETETRYYVERANDDGTRAERYSHDSVVHGAFPNHYVEKENVVAVDVTPEQWRAMRRATEDFVSSTSGVEAQAESEIAPILRRAAERKEQLLAQLEDELREVTGKAPAPFKRSGGR